jgi:hypothetical protein
MPERVGAAAGRVEVTVGSVPTPLPRLPLDWAWLSVVRDSGRDAVSTAINVACRIRRIVPMISSVSSTIAIHPTQKIRRLVAPQSRHRLARRALCNGSLFYILIRIDLDYWKQTPAKRCISDLIWAASQFR